MIFSDFDIAVREFMNGTWTIGSLILIFVLLHYIWKSAKESGWHANVGVQFATAMTVLLTGHFIRSFMNWAQFSKLTWGLAPADWEGLSVPALIVATAILLSGKGAILYLFSPPKWRWRILTAATALTFGIPALVYYLW